MKKRFLLFASLIVFLNEALIAQQGTTGNPPANINATSNPIIRDLTERAWYRGGNQPGGAGGFNNVFGTMWNSPIYTVTNGVNRTVLMGTNPAGSISGAFGIGTNLLSPQAKMHIQDFATTGFDAQGRMFRSDGNSTFENRWMMFTGTAAANNLERFRVATYANANNAYLGTIQNGWLNFRTNNINRTKLNGNLTAGGATAQYAVNGYGFGAGVNAINTSGYMLLGVDGTSITDNLGLYDNKGAFSMLHLNGATASGGYQEFGFRPWMRTGITFTGNRDLSYMGLRAIGDGEDITETTIAWSDNNNATNPGPDDMVFRFTSGGNTLTYEPDFSLNTDLDGLHVSRFTGNGLMGLGNTFGINVGLPAAVVYNTPRSLLHMSYQFRTGVANEQFGFMQITYRRPNGATSDIIGQGEQATDGLRLGIDNDIFGAVPQTHLNGYLRWQEASSFVIQTEDSRVPSIQNNERMRITSVGALVRNYSGFLYAVGLNGNLQDTNPANDSINDNVTRIAISELGNQSLTRPKSLLHLGYDYGNFNAATPPEGYRRWMDLGMLTSNNEDHVWIGLKSKDSSSQFVPATNDRLDAVVAWGTDRNVPNDSDVDNMRFIFTGITAGITGSNDSANVPSRQYDGLEMMRMYPATVYQHYLYDANGNIDDSLQSYGRVGIGDFTASGVNQMPTHKLDVVGNGRFRYLPDSTYMADSLVNKIVMVDSMGVLRWKSFVPSEFGAECADSVNGKLNANKKVVLNNYKLYFTNHPDSMILGEDRVGIGYECGDSLPGKLSVRQLHDTVVTKSTVAGHFHNSDTANAILLTFTGVRGIADGNQNPGLRPINIGGKFISRNSGVNHGVNIEVTNNALNGSLNYGIWNRVEDYNSVVSYGMRSETRGAIAHAYGLQVISAGNFTTNPIQTQRTTGAEILAFGGTNQNIAVRAVSGGDEFGAFSFGGVNFGVRAFAKYGTSNYAVYGETDPSQPNSYAGYFVGQVVQNQPSVPSDLQFKTNIEDISDANAILTSVRPVTYDYQTTGNAVRMNFPAGQQYGMIAQEVENVLPELVKVVQHPANIDSAGNVVAPSFDYKVLNYEAFLPILIKGHQEQAFEIEAKDSIIDSLQNQIADLNNRLTNLENCLSALLPTLCQMNQSAIQANTPAAQEAVRQNLQVTLSNRSTIILDQNVPNPFAEQTVINFSIPASVAKAQMHFYDGNGRLIQTLEIAERGLGAVTVFGSDLSSGTYTYTLVADGAVVATKKMMKQ